MRWTYRLGQVRGVPVEIHALFLLLLLWVAADNWNLTAGWLNLIMAPSDTLLDVENWRALISAFPGNLRQVLITLGMLMLVFVFVLLHEIGHVVQAQAVDIPVRRILLLPVGGLAELARLPDRPADELKVAAAGPAANLGLAMIFGALAGVWLLETPGPGRLAWLQALEAPGGAVFGLLLNLALANFGLAVFNLLPVFPLDGGRLLRGLLGLVLPRPSATRTVAALSWLCGAGFLALGLLVAPRYGGSAISGALTLGAVSLAGAAYERAAEENRRILGQFTVRQAIRQPTWTLSPTDPIGGQLLGAFLGRAAMPVVVGGRLVGLVTREDFQSALRRPERGTVAHVMRTRFPAVDADQDLWQAQQVLLGAGLAAVPVLDGELLHGMLTAADLRAARHVPPAWPVEAPQFVSGGNLTS